MSLEPFLEDLMKTNGLYRTSMASRWRVGPFERIEAASNKFGNSLLHLVYVAKPIDPIWNYQKLFLLIKTQ